MTRPRLARLRCERLEDRTTPTILVTTAADVVDPNDGVVSLREAITEANDPPGGPLATPAQIEFAPELAGATIELSQVGGTAAGPAAFEIRRTVLIYGSGQTITRAADAPHFRLFSVFGNNNSVYFSVHDLELTGGYSDGDGGAVYAHEADIGFYSSVLAGNSAVGSGGAIFADGGGRVQIQASTLTGNTVRPDANGVSRGGAIAMVSSAEQSGGAIFDHLYVGFSTLVGNNAGEGAQVYVDLPDWSPMSAVSVENSILYSPPPADGTVADLVVLPLTNPHHWGSRNLIGVTSGSEWDVVSTADPLLGPLQDNGGYTRTMLPQPGSPAIDTGVPLTVTWPSLDQRGYVRSVGTAFDIGAVEFGATSPVPVMPPPPVPLVPPSDPSGGGSPPVVPSPPSLPTEPKDTSPPQPATATGAAAGQLPEVIVYDSAGHELKRFLAYDPVFLGGVNVAVGDVTGDGVPDVITGAGAGGGPHVKVFDGVTFEVFRGFFAYDPVFLGGVSVAVGDITGDRRADVVTGAGPGGGPHVKAFDAQTGAEVRSFFAYDAAFRGGVSVAVQPAFVGYSSEAAPADPAHSFAIQTAGRIVTGAGADGGPHVKVFDATTLVERQSFMAYDSAFRGGVNVAVYDRWVITGAGPGGGPHVKVFDGSTPGQLTEQGVFAGAVGDSGGVQVGASRARVFTLTRSPDGTVTPRRFILNSGPADDGGGTSWLTPDAPIADGFGNVASIGETADQLVLFPPVA